MANYRPIVLITGCSEGGIGYALCEAFAASGCNVYATARRLESIASLSSKGVAARVMDVDSSESCTETVESIIKAEGRIDILINNAGTGAAGPILDFSVEEARKVLDTNVLAAMRLAQLVAPHQHARFKRTGARGLIANVGSIVGDIPTPWAGVYATSKAALRALTNVLRMETAGLGIDVMLVAPGAVTSGFGKRQLATINLPPSTLYGNVAHAVAQRAMAGQVGATPNSVFARGLAAACLRPRRSPLNPLRWLRGSGPPAYYSAGGRWFHFWLMSFLPTWLQFWIISKSTQCDSVGKA